MSKWFTLPIILAMLAHINEFMCAALVQHKQYRLKKAYKLHDY
jgi:hypothetical protein